MSETVKIRVMSVDDHPLMHEGVAAVIDDQPDMALIAKASGGADALAVFREAQPDVTLMDLRLQDGSGIDAMSAILSEFPKARIIILTMSQANAEIQRALKSGASGYMLKTTPSKELVNAIRKVHSGKKHIPQEIAANLAEHFSNDQLTPRETEVLKHIAGGNRNRDIAEKLHISEETVKIHIKHIMDKLDASDRTQAVAIAIRRGIIQL
jgi:DNA-binding NarL/FixJ family response regulator